MSFSLSEEELKDMAIKFEAIFNRLENQADELRHISHQNAILRSDLQETRRRLDAIERQPQRSPNYIRTPLQELQTSQDADNQKENNPQYRRNLHPNSKIQPSEAGEHDTDVATKDQSLPDANQDISSAFSNIQLTDPALSPEEEPNTSSFLGETWGNPAFQNPPTQDPAHHFQGQLTYLINFGVLPEYAEHYLSRANNDTNAALNDYFDDERDAQAYIYLGNEGMPTVWRQRFLDHTGSSHAALTLYHQNEEGIALLRLGRDEEETWRFLVETRFDPGRFRERLEEGTRARPREVEEGMDMDLYEEGDEDEGYVGGERGDVMSDVVGGEDGDRDDSGGNAGEGYVKGVEKDHVGDENKTLGESDG